MSSLFVFDCTRKAVNALEDAIADASFHILKTKCVFVAAEEVKGKASAAFDSHTLECGIDYDFKLKLKFAVTFEAVVYRGWLVLVHANKEMLADVDFPMEVKWNNGISPKGLVFQQTTSVLLSPRSRACIRKCFAAFELAIVESLMPKLLQMSEPETSSSRPSTRPDSRSKFSGPVEVNHQSLLTEDDVDVDDASLERRRRRTSVLNKVAAPLFAIGTQSEIRNERKSKTHAGTQQRRQVDNALKAPSIPKRRPKTCSLKQLEELGGQVEDSGSEMET